MTERKKKDGKQLGGCAAHMNESFHTNMNESCHPSMNESRHTHMHESYHTPEECAAHS